MIRPPTSMRGPGRSAVGAGAFFLILCGILLVTLAEERSLAVSEVESKLEPDSVSLRRTRAELVRIERALANGNYGDARDGLARLRSDIDRALVARDGWIEPPR